MSRKSSRRSAMKLTEEQLRQEENKRLRQIKRKGREEVSNLADLFGKTSMASQYAQQKKREGDRMAKRVLRRQQANSIDLADLFGHVGVSNKSKKKQKKKKKHHQSRKAVKKHKSRKHKARISNALSLKRIRQSMKNDILFQRRLRPSARLLAQTKPKSPRFRFKA